MIRILTTSKKPVVLEMMVPFGKDVNKCAEAVSP